MSTHYSGKASGMLCGIGAASRINLFFIETKVCQCVTKMLEHSVLALYNATAVSSF